MLHYYQSLVIMRKNTSDIMQPILKGREYSLAYHY